MLLTGEGENNGAKEARKAGIMDILRSPVRTPVFQKVQMELSARHAILIVIDSAQTEVPLHSRPGHRRNKVHDH